VAGLPRDLHEGLREEVVAAGRRTGENPAMFRPKRILVPLDFSPTTDLVVRTAAELARATRGRLLLFHVFDRRAVEDVYNLHGLKAEEVRARMKASAETALSRLEKRPWLKGVRREVRFGAGLPPEAIVEAAESWKADLIVLSRRRRSGLAHLLYGRTSDAVVHDAPCAVLTLAP